MKAVLVYLGIVLAVGACKKSGTTGGGGGGGGSSWLVGSSGLMVNVETNGDTKGYPLASSETLNNIACRYNGEAWVAGTHGTLLYTNDAGASWNPQALPTTADLRAVATQDFGPVFVAGDGVFLTSSDTGAHWTQIGDDTVSFRAMAAAQQALTVLAVSEDGTLFAFSNNQLVPRGSFAGARAIAVSPDGQTAMLVGDHMITRSVDGGRSWSPLAGGDARFDDVRIDETGGAVAVGSGGAIAHISEAGEVTLSRVGTADLHTIHIAEVEDEDTAPGFTAGEGGQVFITHDGGRTWASGPNVGRTVFGLDQIGTGHR
ncbi:MAG TPA: YCF48-related protein, partial [Kofleriaceae bacterium]